MAARATLSLKKPLFESRPELDVPPPFDPKLATAEIWGGSGPKLVQQGWLYNYRSKAPIERCPPELLPKPESKEGQQKRLADQTVRNRKIVVGAQVPAHVADIERENARAAAAEEAAE